MNVRMRPTPFFSLCLAVAGALLSPMLSGCDAPTSGPMRVEAIAGDTLDEVRLEVFEIEQVENIWTGEGSLFDVTAGAVIGAPILSDGDPQSYDALVDQTRHTLGHEMAPRLTFDGNAWLADDVDSLVYLSILVHLERAWTYYRDDLGVTSGAIMTPTYVAYQGALGQNTPLGAIATETPQVVNNALYHPRADLIVTMGDYGHGGVPYAASPDVLAHELGHRVFNHGVHMGPTNALLYLDADVERAWPGMTLERALNEGLADAFTLGFRGDPAMGAAVFADGFLPLGGEQTAALRNVDGRFARAATYDALVDGTFDAECGTVALDDAAFEGGLIPGGFPYNPYCVGTVIARTLYEAADEDADTMRRDVLPAVIASLPLIGENIAARSDAEGRLDFALEDALAPFAEALNGDAQTRFCQSASHRFASIVDGGGVPACRLGEAP